jgi:TPR repeat protein
MRKHLTRVVLAFSIILSGASAADFDKGWEAYQESDYQTAFDNWLPLAKQGHGLAQFHLGNMYYVGNAVLTSYRRAYMWFNLSAYNGHEHSSQVKRYIAKKMTPEDMSKAQEMSERCLNSNYTDC